MIRRLDSEGLVDADGSKIKLTGDGKKLAERVVRRHRLAERFLTDILGLVLLLPPTRKVVIRRFSRSAARFMAARIVVRGPGRRPGADVDGTATEYPPTDPTRIER